eukprot:364772-Chlamydomonas_euryale.AAC.10
MFPDTESVSKMRPLVICRNSLTKQTWHHGRSIVRGSTEEVLAAQLWPFILNIMAVHARMQVADRPAPILTRTSCC